MLKRRVDGEQCLTGRLRSTQGCFDLVSSFGSTAGFRLTVTIPQPAGRDVVPSKRSGCKSISPVLHGDFPPAQLEVEWRQNHERRNPCSEYRARPAVAVKLAR